MTKITQETLNDLLSEKNRAPVKVSNLPPASPINKEEFFKAVKPADLPKDLLDRIEFAGEEELKELYRQFVQDRAAKKEDK
ncbi:MAG: hypothetical protein AB7F64_04595 [Gammaproteobacteria bacterium]